MTQREREKEEEEEEESWSIADANVPVNDPPCSTTRVHRLCVHERVDDFSEASIISNNCGVDRSRVGERKRKGRKGESSFVPFAIPFSLVIDASNIGNTFILIHGK